MRTARLVVLSLMVASFAAAQTAERKHAPAAQGAAETSAAQLSKELGQGKKVLVIDVRTPEEFATGHIPGATNIPVEDLSKRIAEMKVSKDTTIVTMCEHGGRSSRAALELQKMGYKSSSFCKLESWKKEGHKTETGSGKTQKTSQVYRFYCHHSCLSYVETTDLDQVCDHCNCSRPYRECMKEG